MSSRSFRAVAIASIVLVALIGLGRAHGAEGRMWAQGAGTLKQKLLNGGARAKLCKHFWMGQGTMTRKTLSVDGVERAYYLYVPPHVSGSQPPLLLSFHGGGGVPEALDRLSGGLTLTADRHGFLIAFPEGVDHQWNDGREISDRRNMDDFGFISKLIDDVVASGHVDPNRIYACGISNGGFFSQSLALRFPNKIAAVVSVAASVSTAAERLKPFNTAPRPVPIMMILGTADPLVPWDGGNIGGRLLPRARGSVVSASESVHFWLRHNANDARPSVQQLPDRNPQDPTHVFVETYGGGTASQVVLGRIEGGGHTWPGGLQYLNKRLVGPVCRQFDANEFMYNFLRSHHL